MTLQDKSWDKSIGLKHTSNTRIEGLAWSAASARLREKLVDATVHGVFDLLALVGAVRIWVLGGGDGQAQALFSVYFFSWLRPTASRCTNVPQYVKC